MGIFNETEKKACLPVIDTLIKCANYARKEGVIALEKFAKAQGNDFLTFAMMLIVDGTDPELVKGILNTLIKADNHEGSAYLERVIITEGALSIQAGENPRIIETRLLCLLGEEFLRKRGFFPIYNPQEVVEKRMAAFATKDFAPENMAFCDILLSLSDEQMALVFREIDQHTPSKVICGCSEPAIKKLLANVAPRLASAILDNVEEMGKISFLEISAAQDSVIEIIKRLGCLK
jgi:hypothetical protein